jgi:type 1 glutamine amidotransferase
VPHALVLSGGVTHDFPALNTEVSALLNELGVTATVTEDFEGALRDLDGVDLLVVNMLRWTMRVERYADQRTQWGLSPSMEARAAITRFVAGGGPLLALHAATICFDDWPEWKDVVGGQWIWGTSNHPPFGRIEVSVYPDRHPIVAGLPSGFALDDEAYGFLDLTDDVVGLVESDHGGATHPLVWARQYGEGRVVHDALGHAPHSYHVPEHRRLVTQAVRWLLED